MSKLFIILPSFDNLNSRIPKTRRSLQRSLTWCKITSQADAGRYKYDQSDISQYCQLLCSVSSLRYLPFQKSDTIAPVMPLFAT